MWSCCKIVPCVQQLQRSTLSSRKLLNCVLSWKLQLKKSEHFLLKNCKILRYLWKIDGSWSWLLTLCASPLAEFWRGSLMKEAIPAGHGAFRALKGLFFSPPPPSGSSTNIPVVWVVIGCSLTTPWSAGERRRRWKVRCISMVREVYLLQKKIEIVKIKTF